MCRFVLYLGPPITLDTLTTKPAHSIIHQSFKSRMREEPLNGDGFGIAWYVPEAAAEPARFCSIQPAWNNGNLRHLARVTRSRVMMAHVRAATTGLDVTQANCHPFTAGRFAFMHNGSVAGFSQLKRRLQQRLSDEAFSSIRGTTDSEHLFALFRDNFSRLAGTDRAEMLAEALSATIAEIVELARVELARNVGATDESYLNLAVTDGKSAVASRFATGDADAPTLYYREASRCICEHGVCRMVDDDETCRTVVVASEPLTENEGWRLVPCNHLVLIDADHSLSIRACGN